MTGETILALQDVYFFYAEKKILQSVNLSLKAGEIVCLLGASGSGKSTLMHLCAGLLQPQQGTIESAIQCPGPQIGYMQQQGGLLPWRTVYDNIALGLELTNREVSSQRIIDLLYQFNLQDKINVFPHELSGGQMQRVALAQQLILEPRLLLLDEPLGALDILLRQEMANLIKQQVQQRKIAALMITHHLDEALFLADHIYILQSDSKTLVRLDHAAQANPFLALLAMTEHFKKQPAHV